MIIHNPILTGSFTVNGTDVSSITSSAANITSLNTFTASAATTGSNTFVGNQVVSGSLTVTGSITTPGTLTAQTLVVQTITSSVDFVTGSTRFGSTGSNTHVFTGSVNITGSSHSIIGNTTITAGPGATLNLVKTSNNIPAITFTGANYSANIDGGDYLAFATSGSNRIYINPSGSVGVGTVSPTHKLHVYGGEIGQQIAFTKDAPSGIYGRLGQDSNGTFLSQNALYNGSDWYRDNTGSIATAIALHNQNSRIEFRVAGSGTNPLSWTNALTIDTSSYIATPGRIAIGKSTPIAKLDISGSHTAGYGIINIVSSDSSLISLDSTTSADVRIRFKQSGVDKWFAGTRIDESWELRTGDDTSKLAVTQDGRVGLGTTNPPNTRLAIVGDWVSGHATVKSYPITPIASGGASGYGIFDSNGTTRKAFFAANATEVEVWGQQNTPLVLATNDLIRININENGKITTPYQPGFYAYGVTGGTYASGNYWIFPSVQFNRGNHYNASTGVFTAPVAGIYFFAFGNLMGTNATVYRWYLRVNDSNTGAGPNIQLRMDRTGYSTSSYGWSHSKTAVIYLAAGDTARIFSSADDSSALFPGGNQTTEEYPHFMGYLLG